MKMEFIQATPDHSEVIGNMVVNLTNEICHTTNAQHFDINLNETISRCKELLMADHYSAIIGYSQNTPIAVATFTETFALYAGGKIGVIQEFFVTPESRSEGVGGMLIKKVKEYGISNNWSCIELCTPPLPEFERTLSFYQENGLVPVGGRKMRYHVK